MKYNQGVGNEICRGFLFLLLGGAIGGFALTGAVVLFFHGGTEGKFLALFCLLWLAAWWYFTATILISLAAVTLSEEGVRVRVLLIPRFYSWKEISQVGILWRRRKYGFYNDFVLLTPKGSVRKYRDKTFVLRNAFSLIHLPDTKETRDFVVRYYGPLDFDMSDGQAEQSAVVD